MGKTIAEKIFSLKSGCDARAGDVVTAQVDACLTNDASGPLTIDYFNKMEADSVAHPERVAAVLDHYVPCPDARVAALQQSLYGFKDRFGITLIPAGEGIAHQVFNELGYVRPGRLIVGGDSHTTAHGCLNCLGIGVGASDMACAIHTGELWFRVPETIRINLEGKPSPLVSGKDIALTLIGRLGSDGANYRALEFGGSGISYLSMEDRGTICNLGAECCAKCAVMPFDDTAADYCRERGFSPADSVEADEDCGYEAVITIELSGIEPMVAKPHSAADAVPLRELAGMKADMVVIGTCTNGRIGDFQEAYRVIKDTPGPFLAETLVIPASRRIYREMLEQGIAQCFLEKGAILLPPSCGPCCGSSPGVPRDGFRVISTANRNFLGRMGNVKADIYLASPAVAAAAAVTGRLTDPKELMKYAEL